MTVQERSSEIERTPTTATVASRSPRNSSTDVLWRLLVVDDDIESRELTARTLREEGYDVREVAGGGDAMNALRQAPADLVLVDMVLPDMDGMAVLAHVSEMYPDTDVVVMTGFGTIESAVEAMRRGAADFLPKPFRPSDLTRLTASVLRARYATREEAFQTQSTAMLELAYLLAKTADIHSLPTQAADLARKNFDADAALILTCKAGSHGLAVLAHSGSVISDWGKSENLLDQGNEVVRQGKLILSADASTGDCYAYVPLIVADAARGVLCLRREGGPWFHERSTELLQIFATHLALSLETARLYNSASRQVGEVEDLIEVSHSLTLDDNVESICSQLLAGCRRMINADICAVLLRRNGENFIQVAPDPGRDLLLRDEIIQRLDAVRGIACLPDTGALRRDSGQLASFLSVPLRFKDENLGVLAVFSGKPDHFGMDDVRRLSALAAHAASGIAHASSSERVSSMYLETIEMIGTLVDSTNRYTLGHSQQVRKYAGALARALNMSREDVGIIQDGALLHDIGKLCIPNPLLDKPGALTAEEFAIVASHPVHGASMFRNAPHLREVVPIIRHHHEYWDGSGYPDGLRGDAIPTGARIVALADVFDALVSDRIYRPALAIHVACSMIRERAGAQFDPDMVETFMALPLLELASR